MLALPIASKLAPLPSEFAQPCPAPTVELFPHGHAVPVPSPKQKGVPVASHVSGAPFALTSSVRPDWMSYVSAIWLPLQSGVSTHTQLSTSEPFSIHRNMRPVSGS